MKNAPPSSPAIFYELLKNGRGNVLCIQVSLQLKEGLTQKQH